MKNTLITLLTLLFAVTAIGQDKRALIIAIGEYAKKGEFKHMNVEKGYWNSINSENDLEYLYAALERHEFRQENIRTIQNQSATKKGIISAIKKLINEVKAGDNVVFHYSGHGQQIEGNNGELESALVPYDAPSRYKKGGYEGEKHIRESEVQDLMLELRKKLGRFGHLLITLDMAHSAMNIVEQRNEKDEQGLASFVILGAAAPEELNFETFDENQKRVGSLSYALSRGLANASINTTYEMLFDQMKIQASYIAPRQNFQIKGVKKSLLFNGNASPAMSNYSIKKIIDDSTFLLKGGTFYGIMEGAEIAIENKDHKNKPSIQTGRVIQSSEFESTVRLSEPLETKDLDKLEASIVGLNSFKLGVKKVGVNREKYDFRINKYYDSSSVFDRVAFVEDDFFIFSIEVPSELAKRYSLQIWEVSEENTMSLIKLSDVGIDLDKAKEKSNNISAIDFNQPENLFSIQPPFYSAYYIATLTPYPTLFTNQTSSDKKAKGEMEIEAVLRSALTNTNESDRALILNNLNMMVYTSIMRVDYLPKPSSRGSEHLKNDSNQNDLISQKEIEKESQVFHSSDLLSSKPNMNICNDLQDFGCADIEVLFPQSLFGATSTLNKRGASRIYTPTNYEKIEIGGKVYCEENLKKLLINQKEINFEKRGRLVYNWSHNLYLAEGENTILFEALTANDKYRQEVMKIKYDAPQNDIEPVNHLLLIGINDYEKWGRLSNATNDIDAVRKTLTESYQFNDSNTVVLSNQEATKINIERELRILAKKVQPTDNVLIYYAGHGWYDSLLNEGYWVPVEGSSNLDETSTYISNVIIAQYMRSINAKHTLLIADACFSGSLYAVPKRGPKNLEQQYLENLEKQKSRWVLASGGLEEVADASYQDRNLSPFAFYFVKYLNTKKEAFSVLDLTKYMVQSVGNNSEQQAIGNPLRNAGDEGGQFVFKPQVGNN